MGWGAILKNNGGCAAWPHSWSNTPGAGVSTSHPGSVQIEQAGKILRNRLCSGSAESWLQNVMINLIFVI